MEAIDQDVLLLINGNYNPYFDMLMSLISGKLVWIPLYLVILYEIYKRLKFSWQLLAVLATIGVTFFLTDFCCSQIIRPLFMRLRPVCIDNPVHTLVHAVEGYREGKNYGFPSCHASNTFGLATMVWLFFRNKWNTIAMFSWAAVMCYSRVYLGVHYPGDVLVGAVLGVLLGIAVYYVSCKIQRKYLGGETNMEPGKPLTAYAVAAMFAVLALTSCGAEEKKEIEVESTDTEFKVAKTDTLGIFVNQLRSCSRLYTAEASLYKVVIKDDPVMVEGNIFGKDFKVEVPVGDKKIAIPIKGTVKAYIDFSDFARENVTIDGDIIIVELPDPKVVLTSTEIDHDNVREEVSFFRRNFSDKERSDYAKQGREEIIKSISTSGVLDKAESGAASVIIPVLRELGYKDKNIQVKFSRNVTADPASFVKRNIEE